MINWLKGLWSVLQNIVDFIINEIKSIMYLLNNLPKFTSITTTAISNIPPTYMAIATVTITVSIIYLIVNRGK